MEYEIDNSIHARKIVLAGATGFIGEALRERYMKKGYETVMISRRSGHVSWEDRAAIEQALNGADLLINLAGRSVNCRYNEQNRREIMESRTRTTQTLGEAVAACPQPPKLWINSGTATIYRDARDRARSATAFRSRSPKPGNKPFSTRRRPIRAKPCCGSRSRWAKAEAS